MGKLIKKGQEGIKTEWVSPQNVVHQSNGDVELYLERDLPPLPDARLHQYTEDAPSSQAKIWTPGTTPEERMDQTVQELTPIIDPFTNKLVRLSTYQPTQEQRQAGTGTEHPTSWVDYVAGLGPLLIPAVVSAPYWGPAAATTLTSPAFWTNVATKTIPNLIKDTALYAAADAASEATTNRGLGANINRLFDLEDNHPIGDFVGFGGTSILRRPIEKAGIATYKGLRGAIQPGYALSQAMDQSLWKPYVSKVIGENNKIRLRLPSHTDKMPREVVIDPQGNNKFYVHIRTWNDIDGKVPANLTPEEIGYLYEALYDELPEGAEILFPKSGPGNYATRGTVAGLQRLARDPRFAHGDKGKLQYIDKDGKIKTFKGTSFFKRIDEEPEYIERQLIPFAKQQGNWNGKTNLVNNIEIGYVSGTPWAGMFNGKAIFLNPSANTALDNLDEILIHEIRHAYDYTPKYGTLSSNNWFNKIGSMSPFQYNRQKAPIELRKEQIELLNRAYPTKFKDRFKGPDYKTSEKIATNAELRKYMDRLYFQKFNKKPTVKELNNFIWNLSDEEFASELAKYGYNNSLYLHTYLQNIINNPLKIPGNNFKIKAKPGLNVNVNKSLINRQKLSLIRRALTSVPILVPPVMLLDDGNEN